MVLQIMEGLKVYGLLSAVQNNPDIWRPVFNKEFMPKLTQTTLLDEVEVNYSDSQQVREKQNDVFFHFCSVVNSFEMKELKCLLQWATGSPSIPPLGLPRKVKITFLGGCNPACRCWPTASTCDLQLSLPLHLDTFEEMKDILLSALNNSEGFDLI